MTQNILTHPLLCSCLICGQQREQLVVIYKNLTMCLPCVKRIGNKIFCRCSRCGNFFFEDGCLGVQKILDKHGSKNYELVREPRFGVLIESCEFCPERLQ